MKQSNQNSPLLDILYMDDNLLVAQTLATNSNIIKNISVSDVKNNRYQNQSDLLVPNKNSFADFNLGLHVNDDAKNVLNNRCDLLHHLQNLPETNNSNHQTPIVNNIHWVNQVHGNAVQIIDDSVLSMQPEDADALVTQDTGTALAIMTADCVPVTLYQQKTSSDATTCQSAKVAAIHAGWKGLVNGVIEQTLQQFDNHRPVSAWIGCCIGVADYEVNIEVLQQVLEGLKSLLPKYTENELIGLISKPHQQADKTWLNLAEITKLQLISLGVEVRTQTVASSYASNQFYSHRRATHLHQKNTGRMAMLIAMF